MPPRALPPWTWIAVLLMGSVGCANCGSVQACDHLQASVTTLQDKLSPCAKNAGITLVNYQHCQEALGSSACTVNDGSLFNETATCFDAIPECEPFREEAWQSRVNDCQAKLRFVSDDCRKAINAL